VLECAEHLTQAEQLLLADVQEALKGPVGKKSRVAAVLKEFNLRRAVTVEFVTNTQEDLRGRTCCGGMDLYQQLLGISAHTLRHVEQMNEVKADPGYPKS